MWTQQIALNHSSDCGFNDFIKNIENAQTNSFLVSNTTLSSDDPLRFRKNLIK